MEAFREISFVYEGMLWRGPQGSWGFFPAPSRMGKEEVGINGPLGCRQQGCEMWPQVQLASFTYPSLFLCVRVCACVYVCG